ncbi:MAG: hypothetical protein NXH91_00590 [Phyllobacteriaceae bacterium]|jgi:hypothetical protein|nr:hypothetical protein [Phyllobacteriaceae bacterium]
MRKMTTKCLAAAMGAALSLTGMSAAAAGPEVRFTLANDGGSTISKRGSATCIGATCPSSFPSIGANDSEEIVFDLNPSSSSALIIVEYGTFSRRCRLTLRVTMSGGAPDDITSFSFLRSVGTGSSPQCNEGSANIVIDDVIADANMDF